MSLVPFPSDPVLPTAFAGDAQRMRKVFQRHLRPLAGKAFDIRDCRVSRVRYRRAVRCVLQYTVGVGEPGSAHTLDQWVTGVVYADNRAEQVWRKLRAAPPPEGISETLRTFEPVSYIPDLRMLVQVFPYDRRLPTLQRLMGAAPPALESLFRIRLGSGDCHPIRSSIAPVRYRAGLGAVLRYAVEADGIGPDRPGQRCFYVKVYRDDVGEQTYRMLQTLRQRAEERDGLFTVPEPVAYLGELRALVQEEAPGIPLQVILLGERDPIPVMRQVARALAGFHQHHVTPPRFRTREDDLHGLARIRALLEWACPHLTRVVEPIVAAVAAGLEDTLPRPTHCDLKADHIWLDGDRVVFVDLDSFAGADPVSDPALFLARLTALPLRFAVSADRVRTATRAFAKEYFAHVPRGWRRRFPLLYAGAALEVAASFFRQQEPGWAAKMAALVDEAAASLAGSVW
jgi:hypothetical protein